jgi:hypothetical protein
MSELVLNKKERVIELAIAVILVLIGVSFRLVPHTPNFTPIAAIALFGGIYLSKKVALILPIAAMVVSDIFIGSYEPKLMVVVYGSFLLCVLLGFWLKKHKKWYIILGGSVSGSLIFFLTTNFAVWNFTPWYAKTFSGLVQCYLMALPFFKNTILGDLFFISCFSGFYEIIKVFVKRYLAAKKIVYLAKKS